jgi:DNA modification methylase
MNKLLLGDNLQILKNLESESVDLIYLDPPFFSNRNYEVIWGDKGEIRSFEDRWSGGIDHYIAWLKERVEEMHRILKSTGSIFLHCDWHANAYIRVFILDKIFGENNFRSELIWKRTSSHNLAKCFPPIHDTLLFYSKTNKYNFNSIKIAYSDTYADVFKFEDSFGKYKRADLSGSGVRNGDSGAIWNGYNPTEKGRHWAIPHNLKDAFNVPKDFDLLGTLDFLDKKGVIIHPKNKNSLPSYKNYKKLSQGKIQQSIIDDIPPIKGIEAIGYPTQKPEALLERIILCASNENDVILDPFVGGGTTVAVADKLKRQWIGIDQSVQAIKVSELRLQKQQDLFSKPFTVQLHKYDYDTLRDSNAFEFESWIIQQYGGVSNIKQRSDLGIDGKTRDGLPIQVKRSDNIGRNVIDNFKSACERFDSGKFNENKAAKNPIGIIIAFSFGKGAIQEVARLKNQDNLIIELITVEQIIPIAKKPKLTVTFNDLGLDNKELREIEFIAAGESDAGIEFYAWDFNYDAEQGFKATIMIDKDGKQSHKFKTGSFQIAVKVVDNDGLESLEVVYLKVNGKVTG